MLISILEIGDWELGSSGSRGRAGHFGVDHKIQPSGRGEGNSWIHYVCSSQLVKWSKIEGGRYFSRGTVVKIKNLYASYI